MNTAYATTDLENEPAQAERGWMRKPPQLLTRSLNDNQRTSLSAMITYVSHKSGQSEFSIERQLSNHFNIPNSQYLSEKDFEDAIRYLADVIL